jgi:putative colanic acid biosynthesis acetyltransferase WcaB
MGKNSKSSFIMFFYRLSAFFTGNRFLKIIGIPVRAFYKFFFHWIMGVEIPDTTKIGKGFLVFHGQGLVINPDVIIGDNVTVRHNTTIGNAREGGKCPVIGNNVQIGANAVILGEITIGDHAVIAAGSVVVKDVEPYTLVAGNPAKPIKSLR